MKMTGVQLFVAPADMPPPGYGRGALRLRNHELLEEVRRTVRDGVLGAHPWLRDPAVAVEQEPTVRQVERPAIPFSRVQQLLRDLLGQQDLKHIRSLNVELGAVEVEVYALDEQGHKFRRGEGVAIDRICIPVSRS